MSQTFVEKEALSTSGMSVLILVIGALALGAFGAWSSFGPQTVHLPMLGMSAAILVAGLFIWCGIYSRKLDMET